MAAEVQNCKESVSLAPVYPRNSDLNGVRRNAEGECQIFLGFGHVSAPIPSRFFVP